MAAAVEAETMVERFVHRIGALEVGGDPRLVALTRHGGEQRPAQSLALVVRVDADECEISMWVGVANSRASEFSNRMRNWARVSTLEPISQFITGSLTKAAASGRHLVAHRPGWPA